MNDDELEVTLQRYRGIEPPASLRARVLAAGQPRLVPVTGYDWCLLAATAAVVVLASASVTVTPPMEVPRSAAELAREDDVRTLASLIGSGDAAYAAAEELVPPLDGDPDAVEEEGQ